MVSSINTDVFLTFARFNSTELCIHLKCVLTDLWEEMWNEKWKTKLNIHDNGNVSAVY